MVIAVKLTRLNSRKKKKQEKNEAYMILRKPWKTKYRSNPVDIGAKNVTPQLWSLTSSVLSLKIGAIFLREFLTMFFMSFFDCKLSENVSFIKNSRDNTNLIWLGRHLFRSPFVLFKTGTGWKMRKSLAKLWAKQNQRIFQSEFTSDRGNVERQGLRCIAKFN